MDIWINFLFTFLSCPDVISTNYKRNMYLFLQSERCNDMRLWIYLNAEKPERNLRFQIWIQLAEPYDSHKGSHPDYMEQIRLSKHSVRGSLTQFVDSKSKNIWGWLKFIVGKGVAFNWCEDEIVRDFSKLKPISV